MTQNQNRTGEEILLESDSSESDNLPGEDVLGQRQRELLEKKRSALKRKGIREAKRRIAERRFQKKRRSKRVSKVLQDCAGIGKAIEKYVKECGAGADAWHSTGALRYHGRWIDSVWKSRSYADALKEDPSTYSFSESLIVIEYNHIFEVF